MRPETVHPERLAGTLAELRVHPFEIEADHLLLFAPRAAEAYQGGDPRLLSIAKTLAECTSIHAAATWIMENEPWDLMAVDVARMDHRCPDQRRTRSVPAKSAAGSCQARRHRAG